MLFASILLDLQGWYQRIPEQPCYRWKAYWCKVGPIATGGDEPVAMCLEEHGRRDLDAQSLTVAMCMAVLIAELPLFTFGIWKIIHLTSFSPPQSV